METKENKTNKTDLKTGTKTVVRKKINKTIEAARKLKGSLVVNDPAFLL